MSTEDKANQLSVRETLGLMAPTFRQLVQQHSKFFEAIVATLIGKKFQVKNL